MVAIRLTSFRPPKIRLHCRLCPEANVVFSLLGVQTGQTGVCKTPPRSLAVVYRGTAAVLCVLAVFGGCPLIIAACPICFKCVTIYGFNYLSLGKMTTGKGCWGEGGVCVCVCVCGGGGGGIEN